MISVFFFFFATILSGKITGFYFTDFYARLFLLVAASLAQVGMG